MSDDSKKLFRQFTKPGPVKLVHTKTGERLLFKDKSVVPPVSLDDFVEEALNNHPRWKQSGWAGIERRRQIMDEIKSATRVVVLPDDAWRELLESLDPAVLQWSPMALEQLKVHYDAIADATEISGAELAKSGNGKARGGSKRAHK